MKVLLCAQHRHCVAGEQEDTLDTVKRGSKSGRPVEIQKNCVPALLLKRCDLFSGLRGTLLEYEGRLAPASGAQE